MKLIEKFFYYSVGFAYNSLARLTNIVEKLISENKMSEEEGKYLIEDYSKKVNDMIDKFEQNLEEFVKKYFKSRRFVSRIELDEINKRLDNINSLLDSKLS